jgi:hypothetical protein
VARHRLCAGRECRPAWVRGGEKGRGGPDRRRKRRRRKSRVMLVLRRQWWDVPKKSRDGRETLVDVDTQRVSWPKVMLDPGQPRVSHGGKPPVIGLPNGEARYGVRNHDTTNRVEFEKTILYWSSNQGNIQRSALRSERVTGPERSKSWGCQSQGPTGESAGLYIPTETQGRRREPGN